MNAATPDRHGGGILLDSKQMHYILKVVECQNITRAAEQLYVSQPALSSLISKVEEELGAKIFNRNTTPLTLTQEGECYVRTARKILALQQAMTEEIENIRNCREGEIHIGMSDMRATLLLPFVLPEFQRLYPNIRLLTVESGSVGVEENVRNGTVDIGLIPLYQVADDFEMKVLYDEELVLVSGQELPSHRGSSRNWVDLEELNDRKLALLRPGTRVRMAMDTVFLEHGIQPASILDIANHMTLYQVASTGVALSIVSESVVRMMNPIRTPYIYSLGKAGFHWNIGAIWRKDEELSSSQNQLLRLLKTRYL